MICDICEAVGDGVAMIMAMAITVAVEHVLDCSEKRYGGWIGGWVPVLIKKEKELKRKIYNLNIRLLRNVQDAGGSCFLLVKKYQSLYQTPFHFGTTSSPALHAFSQPFSKPPLSLQCNANC